MLYYYKATVIRVIDGDTIKALIDLGFKTFINANIRFSFINTAELNSKNPVEKLQANRAKLRVQELMPVGMEFYVKSTSLDKYGRILGEIFLTIDSTVSVNQMLLNENLAEPY